MKKCIECQEKEARHWASNFCEDCFIVILNDKLEGDGNETIQGDC